MEALPEDFLREIADKKDLPPLQTQVFIAQYLNPNGTQEQICETLPGIDKGAFSSRFTEVYRKFDLGQTKGQKKRKLHKQLSDLLSTRTATTDQTIPLDLNAIVNQVRRQVEPDIRQRCGTIQVLSMSQDIRLEKIYTNIYLSQIQEIEQGIEKEQVTGLDVVKAHKKLMIWGKPGAGKTTFLKHLAMTCIEGQLFPERVPLFVTLKSFAEEEGQPNLLTYLQNQAILQDIDPEHLKEIVIKGRAMILLDGLDEVLQKDSQRVIKEIQNFAHHRRDNFFAITCRIAAKEYIFQGGFTKVEISDFNQEQIACFVKNWFRYKGQDTKAEELIDAITQQKSIQDLASIPLFLTLLCLMFKGDSQFYKNRAELLHDALILLLKKWDKSREIQRNIIYRNLTVKRREKMLSEIAFHFFKRGEYSFKASRVEDLILDFIQNLPDAKNDPKAFCLEGDVILESIEAQHGLLAKRTSQSYSFSHLIFQEYLTARYLVSNLKSHSLLVENFNKNRWREVILLFFQEKSECSNIAVSIKNKIDKIASDTRIQSFLEWLKLKTLSIEFDLNCQKETSLLSQFLNFQNLPCQKLAQLRILYLFMERPFSVNYLQRSNSFYFIDFSSEIYILFGVFAALDVALYLSLYSPLNSSMQFVLAYQKIIDQDSVEDLNKITENLCDIQTLNWKNSEASYLIDEWRSKLQEWMIKSQNLCQDWQWNNSQRQIIEEYYKANQFLLECLQFCDIRCDVREWIETTMFLPMSEIEKIPPPEL